MRHDLPFSGDPLNRASNERHDDAWISEQLSLPQGRFLPFFKLDVLTHRSELPGLHWLDASVRDLLDAESQPFLLGVQDGVPCWAVDVSSLADPAPLIGGDATLSFAEARGLATLLPAGEAGILAHGRSLIDWHRRHRFCSVCGAATAPAQGGSVRKCGSCGASHFPRTDPVVIMVVHRGDQIVLAKRRNAAGNRYSCIAGYIDQGETIEEAVAREVFEEVGLRVDEVAYQASQPWPFPSTLMIGCFAHAATDMIAIDPNELGDARWFGRDEVLSALNAGAPDAPLTFPDRVAIAHHLIRAWAEEAQT